MRKTLAIGLIAVFSGFALHTQAMAEGKFFSVASGPTGGVYYPLGGGVANLITKYVDKAQATAEATSGSVDNVKLVGDDSSYLGFASADIVQQAVSGMGPFKDAPAKITTLAALYPNIVQIITMKSSGVAQVSDLKGKRVATGTPGSGFEVLSNRILTAAGLDPNTDIQRATLATNDAVNALRDGKVDAVVFSGGVPAAAIADLAAAPGIDLTIIPTAELATKLNETHGKGLYSKQVVPAGAYGDDISAPVETLGVWNLLLVSSEMSDADAQAVCAALLGHLDEFSAIHPAAKGVKLEWQKQANAPARFHPGAEKCIKDLGFSLE